MKFHGDDFDRQKLRLQLTAKDADYDHYKLQGMQVARLYSLDGFLRLFEEVGTRSSLQAKLDKHSEQITSIMVENQRLAKTD